MIAGPTQLAPLMVPCTVIQLASPRCDRRTPPSKGLGHPNQTCVYLLLLVTHQGMKELVDWLHARKFKFGLYTSAGWTTCSTGLSTVTQQHHHFPTGTNPTHPSPPLSTQVAAMSPPSLAPLATTTKMRRPLLHGASTMSRWIGAGSPTPRQARL